MLDLMIVKKLKLIIKETKLFAGYSYANNNDNRLEYHVLHTVCREKNLHSKVKKCKSTKDGQEVFYAIHQLC